MNFSSETIIGLKRLCNSSLVNEQQFHELVDNCIRAVQQDQLISKNKSADSKLDILKTAYASLTVLITEAARHSINGNMLKNILEGYNLTQNSDRISFITDAYIKHRQNIHLKLIRIGTNLPHIIDLQWRMDYCIKSNCSKQYLKPFFHIALITLTSDNKRKVVRFVCSVQNLEELVFSLKTTVRHMNKLINNSSK